MLKALQEKKATLEKMGLVGTPTPGPVQSLRATVQDLQGQVQEVTDASVLWSAYQQAKASGGLFKLIATIRPHLNDGSNVNAWDIAPAAYGKITKSFAGQPFLRDHDLRQEARGGTIKSSRAEGKGAEAYMLQEVEAVEAWAIEGFLKGTIDRFSIHLNTPLAAHCSVCGGLIFENGQMVWGCSHIPGMRYALDKKGEVECRWIVTDATGKESSAVVDPAVSGTGVEDLMQAARRTGQEMAELQAKGQYFTHDELVKKSANSPPESAPVQDTAPAEAAAPPEEDEPPVEDPPSEEPAPEDPPVEEEEEAAVAPAPTPEPAPVPASADSSEALFARFREYLQTHPLTDSRPAPEVEALKLENTRCSLESQALQKGIAELTEKKATMEVELRTAQEQMKQICAEHQAQIATLQADREATHQRYLDHLKREVQALRASSPLALSLFAGQTLEVSGPLADQEETLRRTLWTDRILLEKDRRTPKDLDHAKERARLMAMPCVTLSEIFEEVRQRLEPKAPAPLGKGASSFPPQPGDPSKAVPAPVVEVKHSLSIEDAVDVALGRKTLE